METLHNFMQIGCDRGGHPVKYLIVTLLAAGAFTTASGQSFAPAALGNQQSGKSLFTTATFGGNGRTCLTCHSLETGTVSPRNALERFQRNPRDPLFLFDG